MPHPTSSFVFCIVLGVVLWPTASTAAQSVDEAARSSLNDAAPEGAPREDEPAVVLRYTLDALPDVLLTSASVAIAIATQAVIGTGEFGTGPMGERDRLLGIDRWIVDLDGPVPGADLASNLTAVAIGVYLSAHLIRAGVEDGWREGLTELFLMAETLAVTLMVDNLVKLAVRRARPDTYRTPMDGETDDFLSFYSGHAAFAAALAGLTTHFLWTRAPHSLEAWLGTLGVWGAAIGVGVGRMLAQRHFTTDVIVGWTVGATIGLLVPHFHQNESMAFSVQSDGRTHAMLTFGGLF